MSKDVRTSKIANDQLHALQLPNDETLYLRYDDGVVHVNVIGKEIDAYNCANSTTKLQVYC